MKIKKDRDELIDDLISEIASVYKGNDWLVVKKYVLRYLAPIHKTNFSTRHHISKKHSLNEFELNLIDKYYKQYNIRLILDESKTHKTK